MKIEAGVCITNDVDNYEITAVNGDKVTARYNGGAEIEVLKKTIETLINQRSFRITNTPAKRR